MFECLSFTKASDIDDVYEWFYISDSNDDGDYLMKLIFFLFIGMLKRPNRLLLR